MKKILKLAYYQFKNDIREFDTFFWSFVFPLILFMILVSIFGKPNELNIKDFNVGIVYEKNINILSKTILSKTFDNMPMNKTEIKNLNEAIEKLKSRKLDAVLFIPKTLILINDINPQVDLYYVEGRSGSNISKDIIKIFMDYVNIEMIKRVKNIKDDIEIERVSVNSLKGKFSYKDFVFPGILMLSIMSVSFFNIPFNILFSREKGVNKRYLLVPIRGSSYFFAVVISSILMVLISSIFVVIESIFMKVSNKFFTIEFIAFYIYALIVLFSIGLIFVSISKKLSTSMVLINILFQVSMFLGGLYFPIFNIPWIIKWYVYINPVTYLVEGMRRLVGFNIAPFSNIWIYVVPTIWLFISILLFSLNYKKVLGYE
ncbi:ABC transporter permease [Marinitoga aeolica]|uniref:ABC transporter permease n=1 Tax=Marinitoga aeolica TaxID=2809031 RepID=A0ABY8PR85_9BACT|nr:ABC transporter permease [Marinitoga aeolica]WGS65131.1 ABC transporter permease [Marinitoga aeolica]